MTSTAGLTKREIIADLEAMGVDFDPRVRRSILLGVRNAARVTRDSVRA